MLRIPTPFQVGRVNTYLLEDEPLTLVDSGPNSGKALDELERQLEALGHRIEDLELVIITHQHIDHLGLVDIVAKRSGAEVAALDLLVPFVENFGDDAERDDEEAAALMLRHGISEEVVTALRQVTGSFRAWGSKTKVTRPLHDGEVLELARPEAGGPAPSGSQPLRHRLLGRGAADPARRRPPDQAHLLEPADLAAARRLRPSAPRRCVTYLESLKKTRELPAEIVLSGHGEPITDHVALIDKRFAMHQRRAREALRADRRAVADRSRARPGDLGRRRRHAGLPDPLRGDRARRPARQRRLRPRGRRR